MENNLRRAVDVVSSSSDYLREHPNKFWKYLESPIHKYFSRLGVLASSKLVTDQYLKDCFVEKFSDFKASVDKILDLCSTDVEFARSYQSFISTHRHRIHQTLSHYDFDLKKLSADKQLILLCGEKGSGKTTLLLEQQRKNDADKKSDFLLIHMNFAYQTAGFDPNSPGDLLTEEFRKKFITAIEKMTAEVEKARKIVQRDSSLGRFSPSFKRLEIYPSGSDSPNDSEFKKYKRIEYGLMLEKNKYTTHYDDYKELIIYYIKTILKLTPVLIIDDIDRAPKRQRNISLKLAAKLPMKCKYL